MIIDMYTCTSMSATNQLFPMLTIDFLCCCPRVRDFPPDETSLIGVAMGYSQSGKLYVFLAVCQCEYTECSPSVDMNADNDTLLFAFSVLIDVGDIVKG